MRSERASSGFSDAAMLALIGGAIGLAGLVWVWGGLAGVVFGRGWPRVSLGDALGILVRLPARLSAPAGAWPAPTRRSLPGPGELYATLGSVAGGIAVLLLAPGLPRLLRR